MLPYVARVCRVKTASIAKSGGDGEGEKERHLIDRAGHHAERGEERNITEMATNVKSEAKEINARKAMAIIG